MSELILIKSFNATVPVSRVKYSTEEIKFTRKTTVVSYCLAFRIVDKRLEFDSTQITREIARLTSTSIIFSPP